MIDAIGYVPETEDGEKDYKGRCVFIENDHTSCGKIEWYLYTVPYACRFFFRGNNVVSCHC